MECRKHHITLRAYKPLGYSDTQSRAYSSTEGRAKVTKLLKWKRDILVTYSQVLELLHVSIKNNQSTVSHEYA